MSQRVNGTAAGSPTQAVRARAQNSAKNLNTKSNLQRSVQLSVPHLSAFVDDVDDDPLWPQDSDIHNVLTVAPTRYSRGLIGEILTLRIGLPRCDQPLLQSEINPVEQFMKASEHKLLQTASGSPASEETQKIRLPTKTELQVLPEELQQQLVLAARLSLRTHLLPILLVRKARAARNQLSKSPQSESVPPMTIDLLRHKVGIMASWPQGSLEEVIAKMKLKVFETNEIVAHLHEPSHEMMFLAQGAVRISNKPAKRKGTSYGISSGYKKMNQMAINQTVYAPSNFGELNQLTEEPWAYFIRAQQPCYFWCLKKTDFADILESIPSHLVVSTIHMAFHRRKEAMRNNYPFSAETVLQHPPFENVSWDFAKAIADRCLPQAVPKKYVLCVEKELCDGMYFLRHGILGLHKASHDRRLSNDGPTTIVEQARVTAPAVLCGTELVHGSLNDTTIKTVTDCDLYYLSKSAFSALVQQYPQDVDLMLDAARAQKSEEVLDNAAYYMDIIQNMPIIKHCIPSYKLRQFLPLFKAKSYRPLTSVCSTSEFCDRIILLTKGVLRFGGEDGYRMKQGESIGWTCCVPHRWAVGVMAMHVTVEVLEISQIELMNFLQEEGTLGTAVKQAEQLMFPRAHMGKPIDIPSHVPFYPISRSRIPNFNEPGFCTVHMGIMTEQVRREKERKARLQLNAPPPCRQVGNGVWFPSSKKKM